MDELLKLPPSLEADFEEITSAQIAWFVLTAMVGFITVFPEFAFVTVDVFLIVSGTVFSICLTYHCFDVTPIEWAVREVQAATAQADSPSGIPLGIDNDGNGDDDDEARTTGIEALPTISWADQNEDVAKILASNSQITATYGD